MLELEVEVVLVVLNASVEVLERIVMRNLLITWI